MNERIRQLAEECGLLYRQLGPSVETRYTKKKEETIAAFAQLIVQECMDIARNVGNISEPDDQPLDRCYEIEQRIQDRFGVEE
jgi:hypothetical protein